MGMNRDFCAKLLRRMAIEIGIRLRGQKIAVPYMLNIRCAKATETAAGDPVTNEARKAVTVVPIFAPNI